MGSPSPLEHLTAFAIVFVAGAISVPLIRAYGAWMKQKGITAATAAKT